MGAVKLGATYSQLRARHLVGPIGKGCELAGATGRGVGIGATIPQIKAAFPKAKVDHSTDHTFALTLVRIAKNGGGKLQFGVDTKTHRVVLIGVPLIAFCE